mmetsp:Transcript_15708/g.17474  ORF Transcript_15708/g.17474 Transcript_15708/m.17474 type:complete len:373 (+) Transcript_15708:1627-2745(+)
MMSMMRQFMPMVQSAMSGGSARDSGGQPMTLGNMTRQYFPQEMQSGEESLADAILSDLQIPEVFSLINGNLSPFDSKHQMVKEKLLGQLGNDPTEEKIREKQSEMTHELMKLLYFPEEHDDKLIEEFDPDDIVAEVCYENMGKLIKILIADYPIDGPTKFSTELADLLSEWTGRCGWELKQGLRNGSQDLDAVLTTITRRMIEGVMSDDASGMFSMMGGSMVNGKIKAAIDKYEEKMRLKELEQMQDENPENKISYLLKTWSDRIEEDSQKQENIEKKSLSNAYLSGDYFRRQKQAPRVPENGQLLKLKLAKSLQNCGKDITDKDLPDIGSLGEQYVKVFKTDCKERLSEDPDFEASKLPNCKDLFFNNHGH